MQQNPPCELPGCFSTTLLFLIVPKFGESFKEQTEKTDKVNFFFKERKFDSTYAKFKAKYIKRRIGCGCNFIKKMNINTYYAKVCHPTQIFLYF